MPRDALDVLFLALVFSPIALNVLLWRRLTHLVVDAPIAPWRRQVAYLGLVANSLAIALPWIVVLQAIILFKYVRHDIPAAAFLDGELFLNVSGALAALSILLGAVAPRKIRFSLVLSGIMIIGAWAMIPKAIL